MYTFLGENFLLSNKPACQLYFEHAAHLPIIDYHNHLSPKEIAQNHQFENITQAWLAGDHYKLRAMRANGIDEAYVTGGASDKAKFMKWAETVPYTIRNPLYHWSHLELNRYFSITQLLDVHSGDKIYEDCNQLLASENFRSQSLLEKMSVELVCTTDDPADSLEHHKAFLKQGSAMRLIPGFRPDRYIHVGNANFKNAISNLESRTDTTISSLQDLIYALQDRIDYFHSLGGCIADHGLNQIHAAEFTDTEVDRILKKRLEGKPIYDGEIITYQSGLLYYLARMYHAKDWTMQFHLGALRNNNTRLLDLLGADAGCDSIGDFSQAMSLSKFLDRLEKEKKLTRTILYNLNPSDNALFATMAGNFNDGSVPGKIQWGSAWWFLDQKEGMEDQINVLSNMGLLSRFIGMLTDSRSFLSFPRHEYFRRILCNLIGQDVEQGLLPNDIGWLGKVVEGICYHNAKTYFGFNDTAPAAK